MKLHASAIVIALFAFVAACAEGTPSDQSADEVKSAKPETEADQELGKACGPLNPVHPTCADGFECELHGDSGTCVRSGSEEGRACGPLNPQHATCGAGFDCALRGDSGVCVKK
jgi:hypothetical protein